MDFSGLCGLYYVLVFDSDILLDAYSMKQEYVKIFCLQLIEAALH